MQNRTYSTRIYPSIVPTVNTRLVAMDATIKKERHKTTRMRHEPVTVQRSADKLAAPQSVEPTVCEIVVFYSGNPCQPPDPAALYRYSQ